MRVWLQRGEDAHVSLGCTMHVWQRQCQATHSSSTRHVPNSGGARQQCRPPAEPVCATQPQAPSPRAPPPPPPTLLYNSTPRPFWCPPPPTPSMQSRGAVRRQLPVGVFPVLPGLPVYRWRHGLLHVAVERHDAPAPAHQVQPHGEQPGDVSPISPPARPRRPKP